MSADGLISGINLVKEFGKMRALDGVSLTIEEGQKYAIVGESGSGKSTLLYLLGGLDRATSGSIVVNGEDISSWSDDKLANYRNRFIGFVFQFHFLLPSMNCIQNILLPAEIGRVPKAGLNDTVKHMARELNVTHCLSKFPFELSGGEQQRINIIRSLILRPKLLLCDEPTGNLDSKNSDLVTNLLIDLAVEFGSSLIVVTHNTKMASRFSSQFVMEDGKLIN